MPTFSVFDAVLIGAVGMAVLLFVLVLAIVMVWKVWPVLRDLAYGAHSLSTVAKSIGPSVEGIRQEMMFMRQMAAPGSQLSAEPSNPTPPASQPPSPPEPPPPFPEAVYDRFRVADPEPDATIEDTVVEHLNQTDADLERQEQIEVLRERGVVVEDSDVEHEGVQVESE
jgi:hypothetical protein